MAAYPAESRITDFKAVFGKDTTLLEAEFLRFITALP